MTEYIDREKVWDEFYQCVLDGTITSVEDTGKFLRDFPAADVAPVVHGRWVPKQDGFWKKQILICSNCESRNALGYEFNYCFNCGAHMKGGE